MARLNPAGYDVVEDDEALPERLPVVIADVDPRSHGDAARAALAEEAEHEAELAHRRELRRAREEAAKSHSEEEVDHG
jgi:hypothetical protein